MIKRNAMTFVAVLLTVVLASSASATDSQSSQNFKVGICDWTLNQRFSDEPFRFAARNQLRGIQYSFGAKGDGIDLRTRENRDKIRQTVRETGVGISSLAIGLLNKVPLATSDEADQLVVECLETMVKLKQESAELQDPGLAAKVSPRIVLLAFFGKADINGKPELINVVVEKLKRLAPIAEKHDFILGLESLLSEADLRDIIKRVGSPAVKVYYDTANSARMGYDIYHEIESLGSELICELHLKEDGNLLGKGTIDFARVRSILEDIEYQGWLIIEGSRPKPMTHKEASAANARFTLERFAAATDLSGLEGDWSLQLDSGTPAWMSVNNASGDPSVRMRVYLGPDGPHKDVVKSGGRLKFTLKQNKKAGTIKVVDVGINEGKLDGVISTRFKDGTNKQEAFTGKKTPPLPTTPPDLSKVRFGQPLSLFNGRDLTGWRPHEPDKINGWSAKHGMLVNATPKTDFSATGAYANLRTVAEFEDFWLHIEFLIGESRNSGIYLRGMYEAQVVDRDSRMQGIQGVGAIFGRIAPSKNAGRSGGQWQTYDLTLVDRHVTVVLNGEKVINNMPIAGPTGGAIHTDPDAPGPIYLQGDHTSVSYKDIYLAPVVFAR